MIAAIYYQPEGYSTSGERLLGRHSAGEGFLKGLVRHGRQAEFYCHSSSQAAFEAFQRQVAEFGGTGRPSHWVPLNQPASAKRSGWLSGTQ